jgi:transcriptional regulator with XRE-family HTH domain
MEDTYALRNRCDVETNNLKARRKKLGVTGAEIARRLGVSEGQVSRWENGKDSIPSHRLKAMTAAYEAPLEDLFGIAGDDPGTELPVALEYLDIAVLPSHMPAWAAGVMAKATGSSPNCPAG